MKSAKSKRQLTILTLILALVAVYLNWEYAKQILPLHFPLRHRRKMTPCWQTHRQTHP